MLSDEEIDTIWSNSTPTNFEARSFARAIEAAVIERCAKLCESQRDTWAWADGLDQYGYPCRAKFKVEVTPVMCAAAIRDSANRSADSAESFCNDEMEAHDQNWKHGEEAC